MVKTYKNIPVSEETSFKFDKLQLDLRVKGVLKTKDELINVLMNTYKEHQKIRGDKQ